MKDLTRDSIVKHLLTMAAPIAIGMIIQMLYQLIDLYFVAELGDAAIAGVGAAANTTFIVLGMTQVLAVGTAGLIAHAAGRKDRADANLIFNQSLGLSVLCALATLVLGYAFAPVYMRAVSADAATVAAGITYLFWFLPCLALQFALASMAAALRGTGIVRPAIVVQMLTVAVNAILAPVLIRGWGTGHPLGVAGAGLASSIAVAVGVVMLWLYFHRLERYVAVDLRLARPQMKDWKRMLNLGLPAGGELLVVFLYTAVTYYVIRNFGTAAQAGFGIGGRVMQAILLPAMAVAFATGPIAGQNFGAGDHARVRQTFRMSAALGSVLMVAVTLFAQWRPELLVGIFTEDPAARDVGAGFLRLISWNFFAQGFVFVCSGMFQGLGNTRPALLSSCTRLVTFAVPAILLSTYPSFRIEHVWYLSIATSTVQSLLSLWLMRAELARRLSRPVASAPSLGASA